MNKLQPRGPMHYVYRWLGLACLATVLHPLFPAMKLNGASGKSMLFLAAPRCQIFDGDDAYDGAPIDKDADGYSSTPSPPRSL